MLINDKLLLHDAVPFAIKKQFLEMSNFNRKLAIYHGMCAITQLLLLFLLLRITDFDDDNDLKRFRKIKIRRTF